VRAGAAEQPGGGDPGRRTGATNPHRDDPYFLMYNANKKYTGNVKLDNFGDMMPVAAIPAELEEQLLLAIGFKPGDLGDQVLKDGYLNMLFGFNTFTSNNLPSTATYTQTNTPTNGDTVVIGGVTFKFVTASPANAGSKPRRSFASA